MDIVASTSARPLHEIVANGCRHLSHFCQLASEGTRWAVVCSMASDSDVGFGDALESDADEAGAAPEVCTPQDDDVIHHRKLIHL